MKKGVVVFFVCLFSLSSSFSYANYEIYLKNNTVSYVPNKDTFYPPDLYEWTDGRIQGIWEGDQNQSSGTFLGFVKQGRRPDIGKFIGEWNSSNQKLSGFFQGFFNKWCVIGTIYDTSFHVLSFFTGKLTFNETHFQVNILSMKTGFIKGIGQHILSFLPEPTGPYGIGIETIHCIDSNRYELFTEDNLTDYREMMVRIWYPSSLSLTGERVEYMDALTFKWLMKRSPIPLVTIPVTAYKYIRPHGEEEGKLASFPNLFPLIIFSPGYDGNYEIYTSLIEDLVSHGFIVVSINHPYVSGITVFPDGRSVKAVPVSEISLPTVVNDTKFIFDLLTSLNETDGHFKGRLDLSKIGMFGHSFGGSATVICCIEEPRCIAGLTLDGVIYEDILPDKFEKPFMMMLAEDSFTTQYADSLWNIFEKNAYKVTILGSTHYAFTDVGILLTHLLPLIPPQLLGFGTIVPKRMINITKSFELAFFEVYLKNYPRDHLVKLSSFFNEAIFEFK